MSIWNKMVTALRGGAHEVGETLLDSQALRILDQEIRDADAELRRSKEALAEIMAKQKLAAVEVKKYQDKIAEYERYTLQALDADNEDLAKEVAGKIANLEGLLAESESQTNSYATSVEQLRKAVIQTEAHIKRMKQQADTVRATENVQKAQMAVSKSYGGSQARMHTALESLERIKKQQAERAAKMEASNELANLEDADAQLEHKLRDAGIIPDAYSADSVLARLKNKKTADE
ncbi:PspA/IM30 family protein [Neisseria sp. Ec49-e6-T10]|uniref:PspA/IM30 family protein n=1 Tax=Neisseria sp. Ec49-e6-T10 TaxID=3140744 RepID=UPI003EC04CF2